MKNLSQMRSLFLLICTMSTLSLLGCGGCASQENIQSKKIDAAPIEWKLSSSAQDTYGFLLYDQALRNEDEDLVLVAMQNLKSSKMPIAMYIETAIWLMSRRSAHTLKVIELGLELYPNDISLILLYAQSLQDNGQPEVAIEFMRQYLSTNKDNIDARLELAILLTRAQNYSEAQEELKNIPEKKRTPLTHYYMARTFIGLKQPEKAIPYLKKAIKNSPTFIEAMAELAYIYEKSQKIKEASILYEKMLKLNDSSQEVIIRLVSLYLKQNNIKKAIEFVEQGPDSAEFIMLVSAMFIETQHYDAAEKLLIPLVAEEDYPSEANFYLAVIAYEKNLSSDIPLKWLKKIPPNSDFHKRAILLQIQILVNDKKINDALAVIQKAKLNYAEHNDLWQLEIRILAQLNKQKEALDVTNLALGKWPENTELIFLQASLFDELGDKKNALNSMETLISLNPDHYQALNYVGYTLAEDSADLPRAISLLERAILLSPQSSYVLDSLAWAQFKAGRLQEAWENISKAVTLKGGSDPTIWEHYGDIANSLGKNVEAKKGYMEALKFIPKEFESDRKRIIIKIK